MYSDEYFQQVSDNRWLSNEVVRRIKEVQNNPLTDYGHQPYHDERCRIALEVHGLSHGM